MKPLITPITLMEKRAMIADGFLLYWQLSAPISAIRGQDLINR
jgi:hypothetical protein